jgi:ribonucleoside-diphosphate reductase subunit M2
MPGLCFSNELISQDKGLHCNFACLLYSKLVNRLPELQIVEIVSSAVEIKMEFVVDALPVKLIGMNSLMMCNYIKFCADQLLVTLGCQRHYKIGNPFKWVGTISLQEKTNFFEKCVGKYFKSGVGVDSWNNPSLFQTHTHTYQTHNVQAGNIYYIFKITPLSYMPLLRRLYGNNTKIS